MSVALFDQPTVERRSYCPTAAPFRLNVAIEDRGHSTPCWVWQGALNHNGYGVGRADGGAWARMHRATYQHFIGPIPDGLQLDHLCKVRACCNPKHLEPVTNAENKRRACGGIVRKPRPPKRSGPRPLPTHCGRGHEWTPETTRMVDGRRNCRVCIRMRLRKYREVARASASPPPPQSRAEVRNGVSP